MDFEATFSIQSIGRHIIFSLKTKSKCVQMQNELSFEYLFTLVSAFMLIFY